MAWIYKYIFVFTLALTGCDTKGEEVGIIRTNMGTVGVAFYPDTPKHVANFKKLVRNGFYSHTTFHRVIPDFMIQGGDPNSRDDDRSNDGTGGPEYTVPAEINHPHIRGAVAAPRLPDAFNPERASNGSQFYICVNPQPHLDGEYTVFGYVVEGLGIVERIARVERDKNDNPIQKVVIRSISIQRL